MVAVADRQRRDVDVDVVGNRRRIDAEVHLVHRLLEDAARVANAVGRAGEPERDADGDLLAGDELLEVDVDDAAVDRMALDLANQRLRHFAVDAELDDRAAGRELAEQLFDFAGVDRERLRVAAVAVDHGGNVAALPNLASDASAAVGADVGGE